MNTIYKYPIEITGEQIIEIVGFRKFLQAGLDPNGVPCIWALVDTESSVKHENTISIFGTGHPLPSTDLFYLNSFIERIFVWHVFYGYPNLI
jgi:hypothetical protein